MASNLFFRGEQDAVKRVLPACSSATAVQLTRHSGNNRTKQTNIKRMAHKETTTNHNTSTTNDYKPILAQFLLIQKPICGFARPDPQCPVYRNYYPIKLNQLVANLRSEWWYGHEAQFICGETKKTDLNHHLMA